MQSRIRAHWAIASLAVAVACSAPPSDTGPRCEIEACGGDPSGTWRLASLDCGEPSSYPPELLLHFESDGSGASYRDGVASEIDWTRSGEQLRFDGMEHEYCVEDDQLRILFPEGPAYQLERVFMVQTPIPTCESRGAHDCEQGEQPSEGCDLGACVGLLTCPDMENRPSCLRKEGCVWDAMACTGEPVASCHLWHYGRMPGCHFSVVEPTCVGAPIPCSEMLLADCESHPGCAIELGCRGSRISCIMVGACDGLEGCHRDDRGVCAGVAECRQQPSERQCNQAALGAPASACQWVEMCSGDERPDCAELPLTDCENVPGCAIAFYDE